MLACFLWLALATLCVQVPNLLGIHEQHQDGLVSLVDALKIAGMSLPLIFVATTGFAIYYGRGDNFFSYPAMVIYAHVCALIIGILIQVFILKAKETNVVELAGVGICMAGLAISIYSKQIIALLK
ncbi:MAG TPA: hypothetical protein VL987_07250 [Cellvibrio sp.]|jgi:hypothetical protein|nr:hypothetical protein [Cellvibrio sp.]